MAIFLGGFIPAAVTAACLMTVILVQAHRLGWPKDERPTRAELTAAVRASLVPMVVPVVIVLGFFFGVFTATEAGALVAAYAVGAAVLYYRNVTLREMVKLLHETALLTAAVIFLLAVASIYQFLMGMLGVPALLGEMLKPLEATPWLFLPGRGHPGHAVRHGAGGASGGGGAHPRGVPHRQADRHPPHPLRHRAHRRRGDRPLPAADRRGPAHGPPLRQHLGGPATSGPTGPTCSRCSSAS